MSKKFFYVVFDFSITDLRTVIVAKLSVSKIVSATVPVS